MTTLYQSILVINPKWFHYSFHSCFSTNHRTICHLLILNQHTGCFQHTVWNLIEYRPHAMYIYLGRLEEIKLWRGWFSLPRTWAFQTCSGCFRSFLFFLSCWLVKKNTFILNLYIYNTYISHCFLFAVANF